MIRRTSIVLTLICIYFFSFKGYMQSCFSAGKIEAGAYTSPSPPPWIESGWSISYPLVMEIDVNRDAIDDFELEVYHHHNGWGISGFSAITGLNGNKILMDSSFTDGYSAAPLVFGDPLCESSSWVQKAFFKRVWIENSPSGAGSWDFGSWPTVGPRYVGLKIVVGTDTIFAWAQIETNKSSELPKITLIDYGYDRPPLPSGLSVYPNPVAGVLNILCGDAPNYEAFLYNGEGELVFRQSGPQTMLDVHPFAAGFYTLKVVAGENSYFEKVVILKVP